MEEQEIYSPHTLELIQVSAEYCRYLETCEGTSPHDFCRTLCALLPMVYLKSVMHPAVDDVEGYTNPYVTEDDYNFVRRNVASVLGSYDDYLDVQVADFKYSDKPVLCTVSENLADIYQELRDLVESVRHGYDEATMVVLANVLEEFRLTWGNKLLAALRTLHIIYTDHDDEAV